MDELYSIKKIISPRSLMTSPQNLASLQNRIRFLDIKNKLLKEDTKNKQNIIDFLVDHNKQFIWCRGKNTGSNQPRKLHTNVDLNI